MHPLTGATIFVEGKTDSLHLSDVGTNVRPEVGVPYDAGTYIYHSPWAARVVVASGFSSDHT